MSEVTQVQAQATPDWVSVNEAIEHPAIQPFVSSYSGFHWTLRTHRQELVESGALLKVGKCLKVSLSRSPSVFEGIFRRQTMAAMERLAPNRGRRELARKKGNNVAAA